MKKNIFEPPENCTNYVCSIDEKQSAHLEQILRDKGWSFAERPYALWHASLGGLNATAYRSGKLVVQGKGTGELVLYTIEPEITGNPLLGYENIVSFTGENEPFRPHAGVDESGKGDLFGPLCVAAVFLDEAAASQLKKIGVRDSKGIKSDAKIAFLANAIRRIGSRNFSIVTIGPEAYNRLYGKFRNLNRLLAWAHARAIENLLEKNSDVEMAVFDKFGHERLIKNAMLEKGRRLDIVQRTKAESDIVVAAASVIARDAFVRKMKDLSGEAGFAIPKGAGPEAKKALARLVGEKGPDVIGRFAKAHFKTVKEILGDSFGLFQGPMPESGGVEASDDI